MFDFENCWLDTIVIDFQLRYGADVPACVAMICHSRPGSDSPARLALLTQRALGCKREESPGSSKLPDGGFEGQSNPELSPQYSHTFAGIPA